MSEVGLNNRAAQADSGDAAIGFSPTPGTLLRYKIAATLLFVTTLIFAGLFFHLKRTQLAELVMMAGTVRRVSAGDVQLERWKAQVFQRQKEVRTANALVGMMAHPDTHRAPLRGLDGSGQVFMDAATTKLALFAFDLPSLEARRQYRAWSRSGPGDWVSLGLLSEESESVRSLFVAVPETTPDRFRVTRGLTDEEGEPMVVLEGGF